MKIDLHLHSCYSSDGIHSIDVLTRLFNPGDIIALTDHETIAGWDEFEDACQKKELIPKFGVEWFSKPYHVLSYYPSKNIPLALKSFMQNRRDHEMKAMKELAYYLKSEDSGFPDYNALMTMKRHPENILGLMVLGCTLRKRKKIIFEEAIRRLREAKHKFNECPSPFSTEGIIKQMSEWGAITILAHPFRRKNVTKEFLEEFLKQVKTYKVAGLHGIELHSFNDYFNKTIIKICDQLDLIWTIGSDYHHFKEGIFPKKLPEQNSIVTKSLIKCNLI